MEELKNNCEEVNCDGCKCDESNECGWVAKGGFGGVPVAFDVDTDVTMHETELTKISSLYIKGTVNYIGDLKVKKLTETAKILTKAHSTDLGYDLYTDEEVTISAHDTVKVHTGVALKMPAGWGGFVKDRSSVASKRKLFTVSGVLDEPYTGELLIVIYNSTNSDVKIEKGEKIAQLVPIPTTNFNLVETDTLEETDRGMDGFGSSDK